MYATTPRRGRNYTFRTKQTQPPIAILQVRIHSDRALYGHRARMNSRLQGIRFCRSEFIRTAMRGVHRANEFAPAAHGIMWFCRSEFIRTVRYVATARE